MLIHRKYPPAESQWRDGYLAVTAGGNQGAGTNVTEGGIASRQAALGPLRRSGQRVGGWHAVRSGSFPG